MDRPRPRAGCAFRGASQTPLPTHPPPAHSNAEPPEARAHPGPASSPAPSGSVLVDLNCDLGEGEPSTCTRALMELIDSANIACGGHAGDETSMRRCLAVARDHGVRAGAHPGFADRRDFGRGRERGPTAEELASLLDEQVGRLAAWAGEAGVPLRHVKLHGALYHLVDADPGLAAAYVDHVQVRWPGLVLFARCGGGVAAEGRRRGIPVWEEAFLDRGYRADGTLVPRGEPGAMVTEPAVVAARVREWSTRGGWSSVDGGWLRLPARTFCVHGDSGQAVELLTAARAALTRAG